MSSETLATDGKVDEEFYEQDDTCPFLCQKHMKENEKSMVGAREPRGSSKYLYSNKHEAKGFTKYIPIEKAYPKLFVPKK